MTAIFVKTLLIFLTFHNFSLKLSMAKHRPVFSALGPETEEQIKLAKDKIRFDLQLLKGDSDVRI